MLSLTTSIDALAVGVRFEIFRTVVLIPALITGFVCCAISFTGVILCEQLEDLLCNRMEITGAIILIMVGVQILMEHHVW